MIFLEYFWMKKVMLNGWKSDINCNNNYNGNFSIFIEFFECDGRIETIMIVLL